MPKNRVHKRSDGRYIYSVTDAFGKRHKLTSRRKESRSAFLRRCEELDKLADGEIRAETLNELFEMFFDQYLAFHNSQSDAETTAGLYRDHVKPLIGHKKLHDITSYDVNRVLTSAMKKGLATSTIKKIRGCISRPYNWAIHSLGIALTSPTAGFRFNYKTTSNKPTKNRVISDDELQRFFNVARGTKYENYYRILFATGMRPSEALGLQIQDVTGNMIEIRRGVTMHGLSALKNKHAMRDIPITPEIRAILKDQINRVGISTTQENWLFPSAIGKPTMSSVLTAFNRLRRKTTPRISFTLYDFRHTFATHMAEAGVPEQALTSLMGHTDISTTLKYYIGLTDSMMDNAKMAISNRVRNMEQNYNTKQKFGEVQTLATLQPQGFHSMAADPGFEPGQTESESGVLPLH